MAERRIVAVVGATGAQGGGLARAILADPNGGFTARALTRKPDGEAARGLVQKGAQVVACDLDQPESLKRAFDRADAAFTIARACASSRSGEKCSQ